MDVSVTALVGVLGATAMALVHARSSGGRSALERPNLNQVSATFDLKSLKL